MSTATELRKNLFQRLEEVAAGEQVQFTFKGKVMRISLDPRELQPSKLARVVPHPDALLAGDDEVFHNDGLMQELEAKWAEEARLWYGDLG